MTRKTAETEERSDSKKLLANLHVASQALEAALNDWETLPAQTEQADPDDFKNSAKDLLQRLKSQIEALSK